jgi:hypothetical protein
VPLLADSPVLTLDSVLALVADVVLTLAWQVLPLVAVHAVACSTVAFAQSYVALLLESAACSLVAVAKLKAVAATKLTLSTTT